MWLFFFSCSVRRGLSLSAAVPALETPACLEDEGPVGVVEERVCASSVTVLALAGMGEQEGSEELEARDAGGCADGMLLFNRFCFASYIWWWDYFAINLL
jgi:hypothetical protein